MFATRPLFRPLSSSFAPKPVPVILRLRPAASPRPFLLFRYTRRHLSSTPRLANRDPYREPITIRTTAREISSTPIPTILITRRYILSVVAAALLLYFTFSQTIPVTKRRSFNVLSDGFVEWWNGDLARKIIEDVHSQGGRFLPERDPRARAVHNVMQRLIPYSGMTDKKWEVYVIHDDRMLHPAKLTSP
jgi:hypothetical protein